MNIHLQMYLDKKFL